MKKVLVSGGQGKFGQCLQAVEQDKYELHCMSHYEMDIMYMPQLNGQIGIIQPDYFIHAAAMTRPMVDHETDPARSIRQNIVGTCDVVQICMSHNLKLIYISTDAVYPGTHGNYREESALLPFNNYGWSKLGGECAVHMYSNSLILRMAMVENPFPHDKAVIDSRKSSIYIDAAAKITLDLLDEIGIINVGGSARTIYDFVIKDKGVLTCKMVDANVDMMPDCTMNIQRMTDALSRG